MKIFISLLVIFAGAFQISKLLQITEKSIKLQGDPLDLIFWILFGGFLGTLEYVSGLLYLLYILSALK